MRCLAAARSFVGALNLLQKQVMVESSLVAYKIWEFPLGLKNGRLSYSAARLECGSQHSYDTTSGLWIK